MLILVTITHISYTNNRKLIEMRLTYSDISTFNNFEIKHKNISFNCQYFTTMPLKIKNEDAYKNFNKDGENEAYHNNVTDCHLNKINIEAPISITEFYYDLSNFLNGIAAILSKFKNKSAYTRKDCVLQSFKNGKKGHLEGANLAKNIYNSQYSNFKTIERPYAYNNELIPIFEAQNDDIFNNAETFNDSHSINVAVVYNETQNAILTLPHSQIKLNEHMESFKKENDILNFKILLSNTNDTKKLEIGTLEEAILNESRHANECQSFLATCLSDLKDDFLPSNLSALSGDFKNNSCEFFVPDLLLNFKDKVSLLESLKHKISSTFGINLNLWFKRLNLENFLPTIPLIDYLFLKMEIKSECKSFIHILFELFSQTFEVETSSNLLAHKEIHDNENSDNLYEFELDLINSIVRKLTVHAASGIIDLNFVKSFVGQVIECINNFHKNLIPLFTKIKLKPFLPPIAWEDFVALKNEILKLASGSLRCIYDIFFALLPHKKSDILKEGSQAFHFQFGDNNSPVLDKKECDFSPRRQTSSNSKHTFTTSPSSWSCSRWDRRLRKYLDTPCKFISQFYIILTFERCITNSTSAFHLLRKLIPSPEEDGIFIRSVNKKKPYQITIHLEDKQSEEILLNKIINFKAEIKGLKNIYTCSTNSSLLPK